MERAPINVIVKDTKWQKVREQLLGKWKTEPASNCTLLRSYLGPVSSASNDQLRIIMNYLTGSGFRTGRIKAPCVTLLRVRISGEIAKRKKEGKWYTK